MKVQVQPLHIGTGPGSKTVYIVVRVVGRHKDIEQAPDECDALMKAVEWAAKRWRVSEGNVQILPFERIIIEDEIPEARADA